MRITFDSAKRPDAAEEGAGFRRRRTGLCLRHRHGGNGRHDDGETRYITAGWLLGRMVILVWTPRGATRRVISMRHAYADEQARWRKHLGGS